MVALSGTAASRLGSLARWRTIRPRRERFRSRLGVALIAAFLRNGCACDRCATSLKLRSSQRPSGRTTRRVARRCRRDEGERAAARGLVAELADHSGVSTRRPPCVGAGGLDDTLEAGPNPGGRTPRRARRSAPRPSAPRRRRAPRAGRHWRRGCAIRRPPVAEADLGELRHDHGLEAQPGRQRGGGLLRAAQRRDEQARERLARPGARPAPRPGGGLRGASAGSLWPSTSGKDGPGRRARTRRGARAGSRLRQAAPEASLGHALVACPQLEATPRHAPGAIGSAPLARTQSRTARTARRRQGNPGRAAHRRLRPAYYATGDILRAAVKEGTELGTQGEGVHGPRRPGARRADQRRDRGADRLARRPRTASSSTASRAPSAQAEALERGPGERGRRLTAALLLDAPDEEVIRRLSGRRICSKSGHLYHVDFDPPKREGVCDQDGSQLIQRDDDKPETIEAPARRLPRADQAARSSTTRNRASCAASTRPARPARCTTTSVRRSPRCASRTSSKRSRQP